MIAQQENTESSQGGLLWTQLRKFVTLVDELRDLGLQDHINLPRIAVLGVQSAGKSSALESIVGLDFLPRGDVQQFIKIFRELLQEDHLNYVFSHIQEKAQPWAIFEEVKSKKFTNFNEVRHTIEELTEKTAGNSKNIVDIPIVLSIYSSTCPDLTLIDLPGITRIPIGGQPVDIERITTEMAKRYCEDERTIILCVVAANVDITTSEALQKAKAWDPKMIRTVGVVTKIDIMNPGSNCKKLLMNEEVELKFGFVALKNRSQEDIIEKMKVQTGLDEEKQWFMNHPMYRSLPKECYGADTLTQKLSRIMYAHIRTNLPDIMKEIEEKIKSVDERLRDLGNPLPSTQSEKMQLLWGMINQFVNSFKGKIKGRVDIRSMIDKPKVLDLAGGARIKLAFCDLFKEYTAPDFQVTKGLSDKDIERSIILHEGDNLSGFPSVEVFYYLVQPEIEKLKEPALKCLFDVYYYLEEIAHTNLEKTFERFPSVVGELMAVIQQIMGEERDKAKYIVESLIDSEFGYTFTNDPDYIGKRTDIIPRMEPSDKMADATTLYVKEMRARVEAYYKLVIRNVRDTIPKVVGCFLVRAIQEKLQLELATRLIKNEQVNALLSEPPSIAQERMRLSETSTILKKSLKAIQKDPE